MDDVGVEGREVKGWWGGEWLEKEEGDEVGGIGVGGGYEDR